MKFSISFAENLLKSMENQTKNRFFRMNETKTNLEKDIDGKMLLRHEFDGDVRYYPHSESNYYWDDQEHRLGGPAIILKDGSIQWMKHGQRHNTKGPAVEDRHGKEYWVAGCQMSYIRFALEFMKLTEQELIAFLKNEEIFLPTNMKLFKNALKRFGMLDEKINKLIRAAKIGHQLVFPPLT